jgi:hypothetical protein
MLAITFWETGAGETVKALLAALGVLVAIGGVLKGVGKLSGAKPAEAFKIIGITLVLCVFLFQPQLLDDLIGVISKIVKSLIEGTSDIVGGGDGTGTVDLPDQVEQLEEVEP